MRSRSLGVDAQILPHQLRREAVEAGFHRRVRGEKIAGPRDRERHRERLPGILHVGAGALQHGERGVTFVQMTHLGLHAERAQQPPAADAQNQLLHRAAAPGRRRTVRW